MQSAVTVPSTQEAGVGRLHFGRSNLLAVGLRSFRTRMCTSHLRLFAKLTLATCKQAALVVLAPSLVFSSLDA